MAEINRQWPWPVGTLGTFPEEVKALQRSPEKNINASPMPELAPTKLLNPNQSSDHLRMGEPKALSQEVIAGNVGTVQLTHVVFRTVLGKSRKKGVVLFNQAVDNEPLDDLPEARREQMQSMLARESAMLKVIEHYNAFAEGVYMRLLSESKG